jgi:hypothetical protein
LFALLLYIFFIRQQPQDQAQTSSRSLPVFETQIASSIC